MAEMTKEEWLLPFIQDLKKKGLLSAYMKLLNKMVFFGKATYEANKPEYMFFDFAKWIKQDNNTTAYLLNTLEYFGEVIKGEKTYHFPFIEKKVNLSHKESNCLSNKEINSLNNSQVSLPKREITTDSISTDSSEKKETEKKETTNSNEQNWEELFEGINKSAPTPEEKPNDLPFDLDTDLPF